MAESTPNAHDRLIAFNQGIQERFAAVSKHFDAAPDLNPTKTKGFTKFINDQLAMTNALYVITGQFKDPTAPDQTSDPVKTQTEKLEKEGFAVSSGAGKKVQLDSFVAGNPAATYAMLGGALDEDPEEEMQGLSPATVKQEQKPSGK